MPLELLGSFSCGWLTIIYNFLPSLDDHHLKLVLICIASSLTSFPNLTFLEFVVHDLLHFLSLSLDF
jgi:hypothetical protein